LDKREDRRLEQAIKEESTDELWDELLELQNHMGNMIFF